MKNNKFLALLGIATCLVACGPTSEPTTNPTSEPTVSNPTTSLEYPTTSIPVSTFPTTTTPGTTYEKDEEGFFKLEDDCFTSYSCDDRKIQSKVKWADKVENMTYSSYFRLYLGDKQVPIYNIKVNNGHTWYDGDLTRMENGVAIINLEGRATFKLQSSFLINNICTIRPLAKQVPFFIDEERRVVTFEIESTGAYTIEFRGGRTLHLFVNPYEGYEHLNTNNRVIRFKKGVHNKSNNSYIGNSNYIDLQSNTTVILEPGAIIEGGFRGNNLENIQILGDGVVLGANFKRGTDGSRFIPYDFNYCKNITIAGISTLDPAGWCYNMYFCDGITINDIKIISSRHNGDGISLQSCKNAYVSDCFLRTWDDSLVVKNYPNRNNKQHGATENIKFERCVLWTDLAQSMEIGFETVGETMKNIEFNDITVLHNFHKAPISIHNGNNALIRNVKFSNITVEDASVGLGDGWERLIDFSNEFSPTWSTNHAITSLGDMDGVKLDNILFMSGTKNAKVRLAGAIDHRDEFDDDIHYIRNVEFNDVYIYDRLLDETYPALELKHTENITFSKTRETVTGASKYWTDYLEYGNNINVTIL